jgi:hypothetical protein
VRGWRRRGGAPPWRPARRAAAPGPECLGRARRRRHPRGGPPFFLLAGPAGRAAAFGPSSCLLLHSCSWLARCHACICAITPSAPFFVSDVRLFASAFEVSLPCSTASPTLSPHAMRSHARTALTRPVGALAEQMHGWHGPVTHTLATDGGAQGGERRRGGRAGAGAGL